MFSKLTVLRHFSKRPFQSTFANHVLMVEPTHFFLNE